MKSRDIIIKEGILEDIFKTGKDNPLGWDGNKGLISMPELLKDTLSNASGEECIQLLKKIQISQGTKELKDWEFQGCDEGYVETWRNKKVILFVYEIDGIRFELGYLECEYDEARSKMESERLCKFLSKCAYSINLEEIGWIEGVHKRVLTWGGDSWYAVSNVLGKRYGGADKNAIEWGAADTDHLRAKLKECCLFPEYFNAVASKKDLRKLNLISLNEMIFFYMVDKGEVSPIKDPDGGKSCKYDGNCGIDENLIINIGGFDRKLCGYYNHVEDVCPLEKTLSRLETKAESKSK